MLQFYLRPEDIVEDSLPTDIHDLAHAVFACQGCAALLHLFASRPYMAYTLAELAYLLRESEHDVQQALEVLGHEGIIQQSAIKGEVAFHLTQDPRVLAHISEFLDWRQQWIERAQGVMRDIDANGQPDWREPVA